MLVLRLAGIAVVIAIGVAALFFLISGDRKYLRLGLQLFKWAVLFALTVLVLLAIERFAVLV